MKLFSMRTIVAVLTSLLAPQVASAKPEVDFKKYVEFAVKWTLYKYNGEPLPKIKIVKQDLLQVVAYGEIEYSQAEAKGLKLSTVNAIYIVDNKTMYISDQVDVNDPAFEVTLVHEIVHYLQDINGFTKSLGVYLVCTESEAYDVQMLWQTFNKVDMENIQFAYEQSLVAAMKCLGNMGRAFKSVQVRSSK